MSPYATKLRTHTCGELRTEHAGPARPAPAPGALPATEAGAVTLCGHVDRKLDDRRILLRDRYGKTLVAVAPDAFPYVADRFQKLGPEDVIQVSGDVALRAAGEKDASNPTGEIHVEARKVQVLSLAMPVPEGVLTAKDVPFEDRVTYRQVYLRRPEMQARLALRSKVTQEVRAFLVANAFLEIDTPQLFLFDPVAVGSDMVPTTEHRAFSLSGGPLVGDTYIRPSQFDRFFQILPITTNERDPTPLHAQEFTGLDLNMAFVDAPDFMAMVEALLAHVWKAVLGVELETPLRRLPWEEAMLRYGSEKPDLRFGLEIADLGEAAGAGTLARGFRAPGAAQKLADGDLDAAAGEGVAWARVRDGGKLEGPAAGILEGKAQALRAAPGDVIAVAVAPTAHAAASAAGQARVRFGRKLGLVDPARHAFAWVHNIPVFDHEGRPKSIVFAKLARAEDEEIFLSRNEDRKKTQSKAFDLILDGVELASGYVGMHYVTELRQFWERIHQLDLTDMSRMRAPIEAHRFGCPPFASMNLGFDRLLARMLGLDAIDEVMALPKTRDCKFPLAGAPTPVPFEAVQHLLEGEATAPETVEVERIEA